MHHSITMPLPWLLLLLGLSSSPFAAGNTYAFVCDTTSNYTANSTYQANVQTVTNYLANSASFTIGSGFAKNNFGDGRDSVFGLALCRSETPDNETCYACLSTAFQDAQRLCPYNKGATLYYDECILRFSNQDFLAGTANSPEVVLKNQDAVAVTAASRFDSLVARLMNETAEYAATSNDSRKKLATGEAVFDVERRMVYSLAQCTPDLTAVQCRGCLARILTQMLDGLDGLLGERIAGVRCNVRFEVYQFYSGEPLVKIGVPTTSPPNGHNGSKHKTISIIVVAVSIAVLCSFLLLCFVWIKRQRKGGKMKLQQQGHSRNRSKTEEALKLWKIEESNSEFSLYDFSEIAAATDNFSDEKKLGKGGFGPVYMGQLPDGLEIAVKRLAAHSGQGLTEFKNEIQLIAKLQHTNLVRLLGCCIQEEEKILIYEYMPNKSLDFFIFRQERRAILLDWNKRFHIIEGIAQGLLYLHKHSRLRIIHRDLKASNILLDKDLNPKISDFGMARIFGSNMTEANTNRVVGTYGYMAPEYASEGIFSVKSDVFSFGVLLLEIISGKRNAGCHTYGDFLNLLGYAWQLWREGRGLELIDPTLGDCTDATVIMRCIKVALMCVQENAMDRPTMSDVIVMLGNDSMSLPDPRRPPYFNLRITDDGSEIRSYFSGSCSINDVTITNVEGR